ncbi:MAG: LAGLIDADG family homing endonuclease [Thaumarchaeota archaeon]|nr:LAGLIDADG family homing endonuclease [Nitrososphaerota archaeon]
MSQYSHIESPGILEGSVPLSPINWHYISGFFDGEGSITVETRHESGVLIIFLTISQKYRPLLEEIAQFLKLNGIDCKISRNSPTVHEIRVRRIESICKLLTRMSLSLKREQALATVAYYDGRITGNQLLEVFDLEFKAGKRRSTPLKPGANYPLTHSEAVARARRTRATAARARNLIQTKGYLVEMLKRLPSTFVTADVASVFGCPWQSARYSIRKMEANGLVSCRKVGTRGWGKLVCTKVTAGREGHEDMG